MYDAAMDRITRWVPELKGTLERVAAKVHKPPANQVRPPISLVSSRRGSCLQNVMCQGVARHVALDLAGVSHPMETGEVPTREVGSKSV